MVAVKKLCHPVRVRMLMGILWPWVILLELIWWFEDMLKKN